MIAWGLTDRGMSRQQNQDSFRISVIHDAAQTICVVCDGMGGAKSGNIASKIAVDAFMEDIHLELKPGIGLKAIRQLLEQAIAVANDRVYEKSQSDISYEGMGTTLVGGVVAKNLAVIINVGDSRAYLIDSDGIEQITRDHSLVEDLKNRGELTDEQAKNHPSKNLITRVLGTDQSVEPDVFSVDLRDGDYLLLCSDGLTNTVEDQEILYEVLHGGDPAGCCQRLVTLANERGGPDNITIILLSV